MCSRLFSGSASTPASASRLDTVVCARSRTSSASSIDGFCERRRARTPACRRCCPACRSRIRRRRAAAECARRPRPIRPVPSSSAAACSAANSGTSFPARRASSSLTQGAKSSGARSGNVSSEIREVALRIDDDDGNAVDGGLLDDRDAEAGLAAAGHADAERVGDEILRVVQHQIGSRLLAVGVEPSAEVEGAELFEVRSLWGHTRDSTQTLAVRRRSVWARDVIRGNSVAWACLCRRRTV